MSEKIMEEQFIEDQEVHLRDYLLIIRKRKSVVLTVLVITFLTSLLLTLAATPQFKSSIKMLIERDRPDPFAGYNIAARVDPSFLETQSQILKSTRVALKVVRLLNLSERYDSYQGRTDTAGTFISTVRDWLKLKMFSEEIETAETDSEVTTIDAEKNAKEMEIAKSISRNITIKPVKNSNIIDISFASVNPVLAEMVVSSVVKAYMDELLEIKMHSSGYTIKWMTGKADEQRQKLAQSEKTLHAYTQNQGMVTIEDRSALLPQKLSDVSSQLTKAEAKRKELELLNTQISRVVGQDVNDVLTIPAIADDADVKAVRKKILSVETKIVELSKKFGPKYPDMIKANSERESLLKERNSAIQRAIESLKNAYQLAISNEESQENLLASTKAEVMGMTEKFIQYGVLRRDVESNKALYESLLARLKEQGVTENTQTVNLWVVEEAVVAEFPYSPKKGRNILLGLILGIGGGIGFAFLLEYMDNTIKSPEDVEAKMGLPALGTIEKYIFKGSDRTKELVTMSEPRCSFSENFKTLRTSILLSSATNPPKSFVITSMLPAEGKTTIAANLAVSIAMTGKKVLLVDSDMRRPRVHKIFALENKVGLSTFLAGASDIKIQDGPQETLKIITSGPIPPNPSELLISEKLKHILAQAESTFDIIIFDSAPLVSVTDTLIVSKAVDGVVIVSRADKSTYEVANKGLKSLVDIDAHVLGVVVNGFDLKKNRYYYGKDYNAYYGSYGEKA